MKKSERTNLDTIVSIITPENVRFSYRLAGPYLRIFSFMLDALFIGLAEIFLFLLILLFVASTKLDSLGQGIYFTGTFLFLWFGMALEETIFSGRTFGKMIMHLRVLTVDGQPISGLQALTRNIIRAADLLLGPLTFLVMSFNSRFMRLGDLAARTLVVVDEHSANTKLLRFKHPDIMRIVNEIPADFTISKNLEETLALYVQTRSRLTPQRNSEISQALGRRLIQEAGLPSNTNVDHFLCALYQWNNN